VRIHSSFNLEYARQLRVGLSCKNKTEPSTA